MALLKDTNLRRVGRPDHWDYAVEPGVTIHHHAIVGLSAGQLVPMGDDAGIICKGVALQSLTATDSPQRIRVDCSQWWLANSTEPTRSVRAQDIGGWAVAFDDEFVARDGSTTANARVGRIVDLSEDGEFVLVRIVKEG